MKPREMEIGFFIWWPFGLVYLLMISFRPVMIKKTGLFLFKKALLTGGGLVGLVFAFFAT